MENRALRWGILSAGKISNDFCVGLLTLSRAEHKIYGVGASNLERAKEFAERFATDDNSIKAYGSYEELAKDSNIDVIYIGAINPQHFSTAKLCLENGKNLLVEKPFCMNVKETNELLEFAKEKKLFIMEALWSRFFPTYKKLREDIKEGKIGDVYQVFVSFGLQIADVDRLKFKELGGGSTLDIGIYCIQLASMVFNGEVPEKIISGGHLNDDGVDESTSSTILYKGGKTATFATHTKVELPCEAHIIGTKGTLKLGCPFWCSTELTSPDGVQYYPVPDTDRFLNYVNSSGLSYQAQEVRRCILEGLSETPVASHAETLLIAEIVETIRKQIGVEYPEDK